MSSPPSPQSALTPNPSPLRGEGSSEPLPMGEGRSVPLSPLGEGLGVRALRSPAPLPPAPPRRYRLLR